MPTGTHSRDADLIVAGVSCSSAVRLYQHTTEHVHHLYMYYIYIYICIYVCVCARVRARACVSVRERERERESVCVCVCARARARVCVCIGCFFYINYHVTCIHDAIISDARSVSIRQKLLMLTLV